MSNRKGGSVLKQIIEVPHCQKCCMINTQQCGSLKLAVMRVFGKGTDIAKMIENAKDTELALLRLKAPKRYISREYYLHTDIHIYIYNYIFICT